MDDVVHRITTRFVWGAHSDRAAVSKAGVEITRHIVEQGVSLALETVMWPDLGLQPAIQQQPLRQVLKQHPLQPMQLH